MFQLKITLLKSEVDSLSELLLDNGATAVTLLDAADQSLFQLQPNEIHLWEKICLVSLFATEQNLKNAIQLIQQQFPQLTYQFETLINQDWVSKTQQDFKPLKFGKNLWVCPPWDNHVDNNAKIVILNPGVAFGTGTHPTTALCLEWLEQTIQGGETVIDYGCGSGILAIAALKLGAKKVWAVDHDHQALESTQSNANLNDIKPDQINILDPESLNKVEADILIANILALPLTELMEKFFNLLKPGGKIALSGILKEQTEDVLAIYQRRFRMRLPKYKEEWALLDGSKP